jgi:hypothetical protein
VRVRLQLTDGELQTLVDQVGQWLQVLPRETMADRWVVLTLAELYARLFPRMSLHKAQYKLALRGTEACCLAVLLERMPVTGYHNPYAEGFFRQLYGQIDKALT